MTDGETESNTHHWRRLNIQNRCCRTYQQWQKCQGGRSHHRTAEGGRSFLHWSFPPWRPWRGSQEAREHFHPEEDDGLKEGWTSIECQPFFCVHALTLMLVSLPTGRPLRDVGVSFLINGSFLISSLSKVSSVSLHSGRGDRDSWWCWSKCGRWSSSIEMILWRCPLFWGMQVVWDSLLVRFCLAELVVCSSSSLPIGTNIQTQNIVTNLSKYLRKSLVVHLVRTSGFGCFGVLVEGFCLKTGVFFGVCSRIQNEMQALF